MQLPPDMQHQHSPPPDFSLPIAVPRHDVMNDGIYQFEVGVDPHGRSIMVYNEEQDLYFEDTRNVGVNREHNYNSINPNENMMNPYVNDQIQYMHIPAETYYYQQIINPYNMSNGAPINGYVNIPYEEQYVHDMYNNSAPMNYPNNNECYQNLPHPNYMQIVHQQVLAPTIVSDHIPVIRSDNIREIETNVSSSSDMDTGTINSNNHGIPENLPVEQPKNEKSKALLNLLRTPQKTTSIENINSNPKTPPATTPADFARVINSPIVTLPTPNIIAVTNSPIVAASTSSIPMQSVLMPPVMPPFVNGTYNLATGITPYYSTGYQDDFDGYGYEKNIRYDKQPLEHGQLVESVGNPMKSNITVIKANVDKKKQNYRSTRNQPAALEVSFVDHKGQQKVVQQPGVGIRPAADVVVSWSLPTKDFKNYRDLHIGLAGYGLYKFMASKAINFEKNSNNKYYEEYTDLFGNHMVKGVVMFRTPIYGGAFVFRIYNNTMEDAFVTLGTSLSFVVELVDAEVTSNLQFVIDKFIKNDDAAIIQMLSVIKSMRNLGKPWQGQTPEILIRDCIQFIKTKISLSYEVADVIDDARSLTPPLEYDRLNSKTQTDIYHLFKAIKASAITWSLMSENQKEYVNNTVLNYCNITNRFYPSIEIKYETLKRKYGFLPLAPKTSGKSSQIKRKAYRSLDRVLGDLFAKLLPPVDYALVRDTVRQRIERILLSSDLGISNKVLLYGSSVNNFGVAESDVDLCFESPSLGWDKSSDDRCNFFIDVAQVLIDSGMYNIFVRPNAPVPFVEFVDPDTGLDIDLSLNHPLAIYNSRLLCTYANADERVRQLVYIIRYWAKRRGINSTYDGTLSSYAFMILVIHFLQHRPVPLLPNLKNISSNWDGKHNNDNNVYIEDQEYIINPIDKSVHDAYFYAPGTDDDNNSLKTFASKNKETIGELLEGFFLYYAHEYDYVESVVSISSHLQDQRKIDRVEKFGWQLHDRLSIEDPIETGFDIAHGVKCPQFNFIRKELLRAHTLISQALDVTDSKIASSNEMMANMQNLIYSICLDDNLPAGTKEEIKPNMGGSYD